MHLTKIVFILFIACITHIGFAQQHLLDIDLIDTEDGLANLLTTTSYKCKSGYLWVGNRYGLNRYDGYDFKLYNKTTHNLATNDRIRNIIEWQEGFLWIMHGSAYDNDIKAIDVFDIENEKSIPFDVFYKNTAPFKAKDLIFCDVNDALKRIWLSTEAGEVFQFKNNQFKKVFQLNEAVEHLSIDKENQVYIGAYDQLYHGNLNGKLSLLHQFDGKLHQVSLDADQTLHLVSGTKTRNNVKIWKKSATEEISRFYLYKDGKKVTEYSTPQRSKNGYWFVKLEDNVRAHLFDKNGQWLYDISEVVGREINFAPFNIFEDRKNLWFTSSEGLLKMKIKPNPFNIIHTRTEAQLADCRGITEDTSGTIFFIEKHAYTYHPTTQIKKLLTDGTYSFLMHTEKDFILLSSYTQEPIVEYHLNDQKLLKYSVSGDVGYFAFCKMASQYKNQLLVGTSEGLAYIDFKKKTVTPFKKYNEYDVLKNASINFIHQNKEGLWLATDKGIYLMNEDEGILKQHNLANQSLPFDEIRHIEEDENGFFWLSTIGNGIIIWPPNDETKSNFQQLTTKEGLSHNYIYAIYEDEFGYMWASSDRGIMRISKQTLQVQVFLEEHGLLHNEFNFVSNYKASDGTFYFGGLGGLININPKDFLESQVFNTPLKLTEFSVLEDSKDKMTDKSHELKRQSTIKIKPNYLLFELHFSLMDLEPSALHKYQYKIEGYTDNWTTINHNFIRITSLPYGKYTIRIKGQNINEGWSEEEIVLPIRVMKPFYFQYWFIGFILLLITAVVLRIVRWRINALEKNKIQLENEVKARTATIQKQAEELKVLDETKTRFFSNITHEFRTPLTLILGPIEQILETSPNKAIILERLKRIYKNADQLQELINQLLDISKLEDGSMKIKYAHGDIVIHTQQIIDQILPLAKQKKQIVHFECAHDTLELDYDKEKWQKVLSNLLTNAVKFTPKQGEIFIKMNYDNKHIYAEVTDTGLGIASKHLPHIFNRFYQTDTSTTRLQEGTGIGLALVKELIELQKGTIDVESQVGKGTTFSFYIPVNKMEADVLSEAIISQSPLPIPLNNENNTSKNDASNSDKLQLLIIEDHPDLRTYIRSCLDENIYEITEAADGEEGIQKALDTVPDLILSDVMMPKKDGFEVTQSIRQHISTSHIPLILLTSRTALESRLEGLKRGADAYLTKPFSPKELIIRIQKLIELRQLLQQRYTQHLAPSSPVATNNIDLLEKEDAFVQQFKSQVLNKLQEQIQTEDLAKDLALSRMQLHRKIKGLTNLTTSQFIKKIRLTEAHKLLKKGQMNVSEIAYATGFSSPNHFSKSFKKEFGVSPSEVL